MKSPWKAVVIGGGAAGLFAAGIIGQRGGRVLVIDHAKRLGEKIRISGGGRCNFTNLHSRPEHFLSLNPSYAKSALSRYTPEDFIRLTRSYRIAFHEKHRGQLFCDESANQITEMLLKECAKGSVEIRHPLTVTGIQKERGLWRVATAGGDFLSEHVVIATGGLPVPAIGASDFGLQLAKEFGLAVIEPRPALVPLSFTSTEFSGFEELSGVSLPVRISAGLARQRYGSARFEEDLLITHKGLSGPAVLQASSYWTEGQALVIDWSAGKSIESIFDSPQFRARQTETMLGSFLPQRLARHFASRAGLLEKSWSEVGKKDRSALLALLTQWQVKPAGTLGWKKAEVMLGGVDTRELDGKTMQSRKHQGFYFIGECVDVTGHLGGHNFQWAWASGYACAMAITT